MDPTALCKALATRTRHTPEGPIVSPLDAKAATEARDSLAKIIYSKLFDWLVARVNAAIGEDTKCAASVGVLDIYGAWLALVSGAAPTLLKLTLPFCWFKLCGWQR